MSIRGYVGRPGSGKTYTLTEKLITAARSGRPVYSNYPIAWPGIEWFGPEDLLDLPPGLIGIDEAHLWFSARASLRLPPSWLAELSQTRKNGWDLLWSAQHESRVDRVIRDVSDEINLCTAWFRVGGHPLIFRARAYEPEYMRSTDPKHKGVLTVRWFRPEIAAAYQTLGRITVAKHLKTNNDPYARTDLGDREDQHSSAALAGVTVGSPDTLAGEALPAPNGRPYG